MPYTGFAGSRFPLCPHLPAPPFLRPVSHFCLQHHYIPHTSVMLHMHSNSERGSERQESERRADDDVSMRSISRGTQIPFIPRLLLTRELPVWRERESVTTGGSIAPSLLLLTAGPVKQQKSHRHTERQTNGIPSYTWRQPLFLTASRESAADSRTFPASRIWLFCCVRPEDTQKFRGRQERPGKRGECISSSIRTPVTLAARPEFRCRQMRH